MKKTLIAVIAFGLLGGLILAGTTWSQAPTSATKSSTPPGPNVPQARFFEVPSDVTGTFGLIHHHQSEIGELMNQLREADDDAKKADLTKQLQTAVAKHFDEDLTNRETELTKLEERLTKLRAQLDRRRKAKAEIIQLQIKVMVNEAEGLGFSGASVFDTGSPEWTTRGFGGAGYGQPPGAIVRPVPTLPKLRQ